MRRTQYVIRIVPLFFFILLYSSCNKLEGGVFYTYDINFPDPPIEVMTSNDSTLTIYDKRHLNYFNIVKVGYYYYMYYLAFGDDTDGSDLSQRMLFAYSFDLRTWYRKIPGKDDNIILENIADASVSYNPKDNYPFKLVCRKVISGTNYLVLYTSINGVDFQYRKILMNGKFDTQSSIVEYANGYKLFTRLWNDEHTNRMIGVAKFDKDNNLIDTLKNIGLHHVYNPATLKIDEDYILLLPSIMNNLEGSNNDTMFIKSYLLCNNSDESVNTQLFEISNNLDYWEKSPQIYISPGIFKYNDELYISYQAKNRGHDALFFPSTSYKIIKINIEKKRINLH